MKNMMLSQILHQDARARCKLRNHGFHYSNGGVF